MLLLVALALAVSAGLAVHLAQSLQTKLKQKQKTARPVTSVQAVRRVGERTMVMDDYQRATLTHQAPAKWSEAEKKAGLNASG